MIKYFETSAKISPHEIFEIFKSLANDILDSNNDIYKVNILFFFIFAAMTSTVERESA